MIGIIVALVVVALIYRKEIGKEIESALTFIKENPVSGPLLLVGFCIAGTVILFPAFLITIGAGWAFQ